MTTINTHFVNVANLDETAFYSLNPFFYEKQGADTLKSLTSDLNGSKYVSIRAKIDGGVCRVFVIFPDVYCHAEGLRLFLDEHKGSVADVVSVSAGIVHANPTHIEDGVTVFGHSASLQLGTGGDDAKEIGLFYREIINSYKEE